MYHRFNENKYPSTNIQLEIFKKQLEIINNENLVFIHPSQLKEQITQNKKQRKILLTIDDGLLSFYENAWPIPKAKKIPFIFICKYKRGWSLQLHELDQIKELSKEDFVEIGNHSHSHEYLVNETPEIIKRGHNKS